MERSSRLWGWLLRNSWVARGTEPGAVATGSNTQLCLRRVNHTHQCSEHFNARTYSTHAVSGWTPSLPLRVLYRPLYSQWRDPTFVTTCGSRQCLGYIATCDAEP